MATVNKKIKADPIFTHGGVKAVQTSKINQLRRSVLSCLLWEDEFYEDGEKIAERIEKLSNEVSIQELADLCIEARSVFHLRHVPLLLLNCLVKRGSGNGLVKETIAKTIQRADELTEFLAIYWKNGKCPLSNQVKKGLALAFPKFDEYSLAKYNRDNAVKLKDVLFLCHAKPTAEGRSKKAKGFVKPKYTRGDVLRHSKGQGKVWSDLIDGSIATPDTWEVELSKGSSKKDTFERLITEGKLGYLALLRNLRGCVESNVDRTILTDALLARKNGANKVFPFRYIAAARACPSMEPVIDKALCASIGEMESLGGLTVVLVDVSGSMSAKLSGKSDLTRQDAAATLASIIPGDVRVFSFSNSTEEVPARRGMAGVEAVINSQSHGSTDLAGAVAHVNNSVKCDRLIVITDEQATSDGIPDPKCKKSYMINVASAKNGVGYKGNWTHLDGFSEAVIRWIAGYEKEFSI